MKAFRLPLLFLFLVMSSRGTSAAEFSVRSPDGDVVVEIAASKSEIVYSLSWMGAQVLRESRISLFEDAEYASFEIVEQTIDHSWKPVWGQFSEVRDHCNQVRLHFDASGVRGTLICQVYDHGVGFRFEVPAQQGLDGRDVNFDFEYAAAGDFSGYFPKGEGMPIGPLALSDWAMDEELSNKALSLPAVFEIGGGRHMGIVESDLYSAKPFASAKVSVRNEDRKLASIVSAKASAAGFVTPWRVIMLSDGLGDLITNTVPLNLAAPCEIADTSWIKPGKGLWDWRIHGYDNGEFVYGIDTRSYLRLIDFASKNGIEYLTIDDHWFKEAKDGEMKISPDVDIEKVVDYATEKGVRIILYYDRHKGDFGDDKLFSFYKSLGASGMKYGFVGNDAAFTRNSIEQAAQEEQIIFFHDGPTPMTGVYRTFPNAITREYCHAQQDSRRAFSPEGFLKMAMINALSGPLDQANGNFGIRSINAGERLKGPRKLNTYISTVTSEVARTLVIFSGLITLPDAPEEYSKKSDLFQFLKRMPATWDETKIVNCKMGQYITTARRSKDTWFVGSVNNEEPRDLLIDLDFLEPGVSYEATLFEDTEESHGIENPEVYRVSKKVVQASDSITASMALGGGHAMILTPIIEPSRSLVYKSIDGVDLKMHVFEPEGHQSGDTAPAVVFFFGGGWVGGTPKQFYEQARDLAERGVVAFSAEYRIKQDHDTSPFESVKDAKSAVRWLRQHASELGIDPDRIVASGGSAGGHIAACTGVISGMEDAGEDLSVSSLPNAMILYNPVIDTTEKGYGLEKVGEARKTEISPCDHVRPGIAPTLLLHGTADTTVPFENAERFARLMKEAGNRCDLVSYEGEKHGFFNGPFFRPTIKNRALYENTMKHSIEFLVSLGYIGEGDEN